MLKYGPYMANRLLKLYKAIEHDYKVLLHREPKGVIQDMKRASFILRARRLYREEGNTFMIDDEILDILHDVWRVFNIREPRSYD